MKANLDILFIHPNSSKKIYQDLSEDHSAIEPPIWAGMLANSCRSKNFSVLDNSCDVLKTLNSNKHKQGGIFLCISRNFCIL